jgi:hypothetical protein
MKSSHLFDSSRLSELIKLYPYDGCSRVADRLVRVRRECMIIRYRPAYTVLEPLIRSPVFCPRVPTSSRFNAENSLYSRVHLQVCGSVDKLTTTLQVTKPRHCRMIVQTCTHSSCPAAMERKRGHITEMCSFMNLIVVWVANYSFWKLYHVLQ